MSESKEVAVAEQPQALITIEPKKYVELVFEPFAKQYADAVDAVREVAYDIKTTAGMAAAIKHRAVFRDIRVASEKARKLRKAPILEIGKLLDSRQGEIESTLLPLETMFDEEIKAEEARKDAEKIAKAVAESARITAIRAKINEIKDCVVVAMGRSSDEIESAISELESTQITLEEYGEFSGEARAAQVATVDKLKGMLVAQLALEVEQARLAAEREQLAKERAEAAERERLAALERQRVEDEQRIAQAKAQAAMLAEQQAHERRMAEEREAANAAWLAQHEAEQASFRAQQEAADKLAAATSEIQGIQQQVIIAQSGRLGVRKGGTIECLRDTLAETQAWEIDPERFGILTGSAESAKTTAVAEIRRLLAEAEAKEREDDEQRRQREEAERETARLEAEAAQAAADKAAREQAERDAAEREQIRRVRVQFEKNGPESTEIISVLADHYNVSPEVARHWLGLRFWAQMEAAA